MRIDRRGNPAYRSPPTAAELDANVDLTGNVTRRLPASDDGGSAGDRQCPPTLSEAFSKLDSRPGGLLKSLGSVFAAVGLALKDIRQGNSRTFD